MVAQRFPFIVFLILEQGKNVYEAKSGENSGCGITTVLLIDNKFFLLKF